MVVDGIDFNADFAARSEKQAWMERHSGLCGHLTDEQRQKFLSGVYDRLTGRAASGKPNEKAKPE